MNDSQSATSTDVLLDGASLTRDLAAPLETAVAVDARLGDARVEAPPTAK